MKKALVCVFAVLLTVLAAGHVYPGAFLSREKTNEDSQKGNKEGNNTEKNDYEDYETKRKLLYEKMVKRTRDFKDELDNLLLMVNSLAKKAQEEKNVGKVKELVFVMSDCNSALGDLGLMQVVLDLGKFAQGDKFAEYCIAMEDGYERAKGNFSLKNEVFLGRIDSLKDADALRYEKKMYKIYRDYFEYEPKADRIEDSAEFIKNKEKGLKEKEK